MPTQAKEIFDARSQSLRELLSKNGLGLYLPPYQRPYDWSKDKVERLLDDTLHGLSNLGEAPDTFTFFGTVITIHDVNHVTVNPIVKPDVPSQVLTIIDGQQRLSSLLLLLVSLHNLIRQRSWKVFKGKNPDPTDSARTHLYSETVLLLETLGTAFYERWSQALGDAPIYPRLIRSPDDQWAHTAKLKRYESPIAHLVYSYSVCADAEGAATRPTDFKPKPRPDIGGEGDLIRRFTEIRTALTKLSQRKPIEELEDLPPLSILASGIVQNSLFNHELDPGLCTLLVELKDEPEAELMRLVMFAAYSLNRIALTVVQGKDEDYAFTIFDSLNTTGEPLTAFETFLPRVVMKERIENYQGSKAHEYMTTVQNYLNRFEAGDKLQDATRDLLVTFALAETGKKLSKRLSDQRVYMKDTLDGCKDDDRTAYLRHLSDTATFVGATWEPASGPRQLVGLDSTAMTDTIKLCLAFLKDLNHTIAIAPMVRFYSAAVNAAEGEEQTKRVAEFEAAVKAITAFTVFWRATRRGTGNIDSQYRAVMAGENSRTDVGPFARQRAKPDPEKPQPVVDVGALKAELVARLTDTDKKYGGIPNLKSFLVSAAALPLYTISQKLTRFLLLAAYHDAAEDKDRPGLITDGKQGLAPCFTYDGWIDEGHYTIEHIAPQQKTSDWDADFYGDKEVVHRLGNLVLAPRDANSSLSSRPWTEKRVLYAALGAPTPDEAKSILDGSGLTFNQTTEELAQMSHYLPHLRALGQRTDKWDPKFMEDRAEVLLRRAYMRLKDWLGLEWSESSDEPVFQQVDEYDDLDVEDNADVE